MFAKTNAYALLAGLIGFGIFSTADAKAHERVTYVSSGHCYTPTTVVYERPVYRTRVYTAPTYYVPARRVVYTSHYYPAYRPVVRYAPAYRHYRSYGSGFGFAYHRGYYGRGFAVGARW